MKSPPITPLAISKRVELVAIVLGVGLGSYLLVRNVVPVVPVWAGALLYGVAAADLYIAQLVRSRLSRGEVGWGPGRIHPIAVARALALAKASAYLGAVALGFFGGMLVFLLTEGASLTATHADRPGAWIGAAGAVLLLAAAALAGIVVAAGLVPLGRAEALLQPRAVPVAACLLVLATCLAALRLRGLAGGAALTLGTVLSLNLLVGFTATRPLYDTHRIAAAIAPFQPAGIAFYGQSYHAEFNFAGRLTAPVATPATAGDLAAWLAAHPAGVIVARLDRTHPAWPPRETILFRNAPYAVWHTADASRLENSP